MGWGVFVGGGGEPCTPVVTPKTAEHRETITWTSELKKRCSNSKSKKKKRQALESIPAWCD